MKPSHSITLPKTALASSVGLVGGFLFVTLASMAQVSPSFALSGDHMEILSHMSLVYLDDGQGGLAKTIRVEGVNVQIVNGDGETASTNGVGNLLLGYNEPRFGQDVNDRTGSHNMIVGKRNNYSSYGGAVIGSFNSASNQFASVIGGSFSCASGIRSTIVGGVNNIASGHQSTVVGGSLNDPSGNTSTVIGGQSNDATGLHTLITGGFLNTASGRLSAIAGGRLNTADGAHSTIGGGNERQALGEFDWVAGTLFEDE